MKYSKRYIAFTGVLAVALLIKFNNFGEQYQTVNRFRGAQLEEETWNPLIAQSVNEGLLSVVIDNKEYTNEKYQFFVDSNLDIMVPVSILRDALNCSAHIYNEDTLLVEKHNSELSFSLNDDMIEVNGKKEKVVSPLIKKNKEYYVSLNDLSNYLDYSYTWNIQENKAQAADVSESATIIPTKYDLRDRARVSAIRNQGTYGTCWSFAALSAMESVLLPEQDYQFSVDHMTLNNGFHLAQDDGGEYTMGMAYLASWKGPVFEKDDPYGDNKTNPDLTAVKHVQEMQIIDGKDYEKIKEAVFKYGGVESSLYSTIRSSQDSSAYYNRENSAYCYIGTEKPNHDVVIIGWDDNYPSSNFNTQLEGDGAFICQNSWGSDFGEDGIFYVSYYDTNIGTHNVVYTRVDDTDNYDKIYQSDLCGWVGNMGYGSEQIYGANVFQAKGNEKLSAASFYATGANTEYELYVVHNFKNEKSFANREKLASGIVKKAGYYTVDFDEQQLKAGEKYAIVLYVKTPGSKHPLAIEYDTGESILQGVDLDDGEGYISLNGKKFVNAKEKRECNLCIKAFTRN